MPSKSTNNLMKRENLIALWWILFGIKLSEALQKQCHVEVSSNMFGMY
jgi:hypothetical protein